MIRMQSKGILLLLQCCKSSLTPRNAHLRHRWAGAVTRSLSGSAGDRSMQSLFLSDISLTGHSAPLLLGFFNYFERHLPSVGFFSPVADGTFPHTDLNVPRHVELAYRVFGLKGDPASMVGVTDFEAAKLISSGKQSELLDRVYSAFASYREHHGFVLVEGPGPVIGGTELDAQVAQTLNSPVLLGISGKPRMTATDYYNLAMTKRQVFLDHKVDVLGVVLNQVPRPDHAIITAQLRERFDKEGLPFAGAVPDDPLLSSVRLDEVTATLAAEAVFGGSSLDQEFDEVLVASQRIEELLEILEERKDSRPLIVTSMDRLDIVLGLLAAQLSVRGPTVAGILLTQAGHSRASRTYARHTVGQIYGGLQEGGLYRGSLLPVMAVDKPTYECLMALDKLHASILPTSTRKISHCKVLFDRHISADAVVAGLQRPKVHSMAPKMFIHNIKSKCKQTPQHIVLPEAVDNRVLAAAADVTQRGLARITLLGDPTTVQSEAKKLGLDISACKVINPQQSDALERYADLLVEARRKKGLSRMAALDSLTGDPNMFGTLMIASGDADGMVSGAIHTTAATIRPALQVLKSPTSQLVSSVFFMCLPDKVLVYGDCAVNVNPSAKELAQIAIDSADTAAAFGIEPRVAMLSYSTLGSGAGPEVVKVSEAVALVKAQRPDIAVEGPIQYDAAIDPAVAAVKVKGDSQVAGRATVFIFPDLNTGNNTYKAVQQATGAIAMGPVMQGLLKPVNDLSRGCTVPDIINTVCVTSIQAQQCKGHLASAQD